MGRRERWMALSFALGSTCFILGPFPGYLALVGETADGVTFFVGSVFFTLGGGLQTVLAIPARHIRGAARVAWRVAVVQFAGTLCFNVTTFRALHTALSNPSYNALVWRPDAVGSICFLVSGALAYAGSSRRGWLPARGGAGWWSPTVNLVGCVLFGISAVAGHVVPSSGSIRDLAAANVTTALGAVCFFACAVAVLREDRHATASVAANTLIDDTAMRSGRQSSLSEMPAKNSTAAKKTVDKM